MIGDTIFSLEAKIINAITEPMTLGQIADKLDMNPTPLLKALQYMYQKKQVACDRNMEEGKLYWRGITMRPVQGTDTVRNAAPVAFKQPIEPPPVVKAEPKKEEPKPFAAPAAVKEPPPVIDKKREAVQKLEEPNKAVAQKLDRRSSEFKNQKKQLIRPHCIISEFSAEVLTDGTVCLYEILPIPGQNEPKVQQEMAIPFECIDGFCEVLQQLKKLHEKAQG